VAKVFDKILKKWRLSIAGWGIFTYTGYLLDGLTLGIVVWLQSRNFSIREIFFMLWPGNILLSWVVVKINDASDVDFTFMEAYSKLSTRIWGKINSFPIIFRIILFPVVNATCILALIVLVVWYGAGSLVIFLKTGRVIPKAVVAVVLIIASGVQMLIWTTVYFLGVDVLQIIGKFFH
jgi:hypothetical protein